MSNTRDVGCGFQGNASYSKGMLVYPAANRNKEPILQVLKRFIIPDADENHTVFLEISSGSGQHIVHFAPHFPDVTFQPSEIDETLFGSIKYNIDKCITKNILQPVFIDIRNKLSYYGFEENSLDYIYNANMIHISPFECTIGLFENAGAYLKSEGLMITYGPYSKDGVISPQSNVSFHASLKARDASWGIRDINDLEKLAQKNNITLIDTIEMPANNKTLIWKKK